MARPDAVEVLSAVVSAIASGAAYVAPLVGFIALWQGVARLNDVLRSDFLFGAFVFGCLALFAVVSCVVAWVVSFRALVPSGFFLSYTIPAIFVSALTARVGRNDLAEVLVFISFSVVSAFLLSRFMTRR